MIARCRERYTRPISQVDADIAARRSAYRTSEYTPIDLVLKVPIKVVTQLRDAGITHMKALLATSESRLMEVLGTHYALVLAEDIEEKNLRVTAQSAVKQ